MNRLPRALTASLSLVSLLVLCLGADNPSAAAPAEAGLSSIDHIVVIYQENWSFDGQYGSFPGANGVPFGTTVTQVDVKGTP